MKTNNFENFLLRVASCSPSLYHSKISPIDMLIENGVIKDKESINNLTFSDLPEIDNFLDEYRKGNCYMEVAFNDCLTPDEFELMVKDYEDIVFEEIEDNLLTTTTKREQLIYLFKLKRRLEESYIDRYVIIDSKTNQKQIYPDIFLTVDEKIENKKEIYYYNKEDLITYLYIQKVSVIKVYDKMYTNLPPKWYYRTP